MKRLYVEMKDCFGIKSLEKEFKFDDNKGQNTYAIYARNGLMKTSFAKTFKKIQDNKVDEIKDDIFDIIGNINIKVDDNNIDKNDIFVIQSYESAYESKSLAALLVDEKIKKKITKVLTMKTDLLKSLEKHSGLKISKILKGKRTYELENTIMEDFNFSESSFLLNIKKFDFSNLDISFNEVKYKDIFDSSVLKKIKAPEFQEHVLDFMKKSDEIYKSYNFLDKGNFTLPRLKLVCKELKDNNFFVKNNKIVLNGTYQISKIKDFDNQINEIEEKLKNIPIFKEIEKMLSDVKGTVLIEILEKNPTLIYELKISNLNKLKRKLWLMYLKSEEENFNKLKEEFIKLEEIINEIKIDNSPWIKALSIFEKRFSVPYKMTIDNIKSAIIGDNIPKVKFNFCKDGNFKNKEINNWTNLSRDELEEKNTLSQGEKRALYLLNIIFDVEKRKSENKRTIFIVDDIADSFDYKNKYSIVEYLYEMSKIEGFYLIILSHNFDFYRTVSLRLGLGREYRLSAEKINNEIKLVKEKYQKQPFKAWKENLVYKNIIALIPFLRNMIEYGTDLGISKKYKFNSDYEFLTSLLHVKYNTDEINLKMLKVLYDKYFGISKFKVEDDDSIKISEILIKTADEIKDNDIDLENKIVLAIAIRYNAENFMINEIAKSDEIIEYKNKEINNKKILEEVKNLKNQTRELYNFYKQIGDEEKLKILEEVNIMTPENIHLNSFMYEPIQDMDIYELLALYRKVKKLNM